MKTKTSTIAGQFYDADKEQLAANIESYHINTTKDCQYLSRAVIVPHAGHQYSGHLAAKGFQYLNPELETLFVFAPAHRVPVETLAVTSFDAFSTPLGEVYVHKDLTRDMEKMGYPVIDAAFTNEHSIEVQLPFIKQFMPNTNIVPVLVGSANPQIITDIIAKYWDNENIGFVISSDLSHFYNRQEASRIDAVTADMIENNINVLENCKIFFVKLHDSADVWYNRPMKSKSAAS